ncbi:MAG: alpha/beta hydrolase [Frankiaceae bacterium]
MPAADTAVRNDTVTLPNGGPRLALRRANGSRRPFLQVHGLASNAQMWDGVTRRLADAGHEVAAVDLRGHGRSEVTVSGYDTATAAADLAALIRLLGWIGDRAPIIAGQSWGGHVVLELAARHGGVAAVAMVDGGWVRLSPRFADFDESWRALAPPVFSGVTQDDLESQVWAWTAGWPPEGVAGALANFAVLPDGTVAARLSFEHHKQIVASLWEHDPRALYPLVEVPALLLVAVDDGPDPAAKQAEVAEALAGLPDAEVCWYADAHHDLHAQLPERTSADLLRLAVRAELR